MRLEKRKFLQKVFKEKVIPQFEGYWQKVFNCRVESNEIKRISPYGDIVKYFGNSGPESEKEKKISFVETTLPPVCVFWDVAFAFYTLFFPNEFPSFAHVANAFLENLGEVKLQPENYPAIVHSWILKVANEGKPSHFFTHPIESFLALEHLNIEIALAENVRQNPVELYEKKKAYVDQMCDQTPDDVALLEKEWLTLNVEKKLSNLNLDDQ